MSNKRLTQQQINEILELSQAFSNRDIAKELNISEHTVARYVGIKHKRSDVSDEMIVKMKKLRDENGLSHSQIAKELGVARSTVETHLGPQKSMNRATYGSLVTFATGDTFVKESKMNGSKLKQTKTSVSWDGKEYSYKASTDGQVRISSPTGEALTFSREQFINFIDELNEIRSWIEENSKKESVMLYHQ